MTWRRTAIICLATTLLFTACTDEDKKQPEGQQFQIIAGGGTNPNATKALDLALTGTFSDIDVAPDGTIRLLMSEAGQTVIRVVRPNGSARRIAVDRKIVGGSQLAVAGDGTMYISSSSGAAGGVSKIADDGTATTMIGNGRAGFTADGGMATGPASPIHGLAVDRSGLLVVGELRRLGPSPFQSVGLIRQVSSDGRWKTIAGRPDRVMDYSDAITRSVSPPTGTKALGWPIPGTLQLSSLATGSDGTIYAQSEQGVLAVSPEGLITAKARRRDPAAAPVADRPFSNEGDAADAAPQFDRGNGITEDGGWLTLPVAYSRSDGSRSRPPAYRWLGTYTPGQKAIIDSSDQQAQKDGLQQILRMVKPDGSLTTAAWAISGGAVRAGNLYVAISGARDHMLLGRITLPA